MLRSDETRTGAGKKLIQSTAPQVWIEEFERLDQNVKRYIGHKKFVNLVSNLLKERCQHNTTRSGYCRNCGEEYRTREPTDEPLERFLEALSDTILVLRNESMNLERIPRENLTDSDIQVELEYSEAFMFEMENNELLRLRLGIQNSLDS